jgi:uncharacterized protein (TIRG00374 family)
MAATDLAASQGGGAPSRSGLARLPKASRLGLRVVISVVLLVILILKVPGDSITPKNAHAGTLAFLAAGLALTLIGFVLSAWRWSCVLRAFGVHITLRTLVMHMLAGQFVGNVLPSTVGGDVLRVARTARPAGGTNIAFASVVIERTSGSVALPLLVALGFVARPSLLHVEHAWLALLIAGATIVELVVILVVAGHPRLAGHFATRENWKRYIGAVHIGVDRLRHTPRRALTVVVVAICYQSTVVVSVWCAAHALGVDVANAALLMAVPAVAMAQVLPISVSGLGIREGLLVLLLHPLGVPTGQAVGIGLFWYAMVLVVSLLGAPAFAVGHGHGRRGGDGAAATVGERPPVAATPPSA